MTIGGEGPKPDRAGLIAGTAMAIAAGLAFAVLSLRLGRAADDDARAAAWQRLAAAAPAPRATFDPARLEGLPEPARRFLGFAIAPGTPIATVAEFTMGGRFAPGTREAPGWLPMRARQVLAAPQGFVWALDAGSGATRIVGSDGLDGRQSWTRFRLAGLLPVARLGGGPDHRRAAFGRAVAEAVFWTPAAALPGPGVRWEEIDVDTARVAFAHDGLEQAVDVHVAPDGRPIWIRFERWSDANPQRRYRLQPFGGRLSDFREVQGYRVPFRVEAGNFFGTPQHFVFYDARIAQMRFLPSP